MNYFHTINFRRTSKTAPGTPNNPTIIEVTTFKPIWKEKFAPIKFIKNMSTPPAIEFISNFNINFIGFANNLPNKKTKQIHAKYVIIIFDSKSNTSYLFVCWL